MKSASCFMERQRTTWKQYASKVLTGVLAVHMVQLAVRDHILPYELRIPMDFRLHRRPHATRWCFWTKLSLVCILLGMETPCVHLQGIRANHMSCITHAWIARPIQLCLWCLKMTKLIQNTWLVIHEDCTVTVLNQYILHNMWLVAPVLCSVPLHLWGNPYAIYSESV